MKFPLLSYIKSYIREVGISGGPTPVRKEKAEQENLLTKQANSGPPQNKGLVRFHVNLGVVCLRWEI